MAKMSDSIDDDVGVVDVRRWNSLLQLTTLLSHLEDLAASPVGEIESPSSLVAALDRGFLKKRKRSPRNHLKSRFKKPQSPNTTLCVNQIPENNPRIDHNRRRLVIKLKLRPNSTSMKNPNFLAALLDRGFLVKRKRSPRNHKKILAKPRIDQQEAILKKPPIGDGQTPETRNPNFESKKRKRNLELEEEISPNCWGKSKRRQLLDRHILDNILSLQPQAIRARMTGVVWRVLLWAVLNAGRFCRSGKGSCFRVRWGGCWLIQPLCLEECEEWLHSVVGFSEKIPSCVSC